MRAQAQQATITHAVIGAQETINFGISNDPAFFQILSSSLYKNPVLAVVRETMCNAHDAHIVANVKKPIRIDIDYENSYISFRDFGPGIHHDLIGSTYGVYGGSTKKTDKRQTGSFGLGCKAPFAYVEHFEVTSWHQGVKSVYNMSRSSAAKDGTPGITRLLHVPTDEQGLQVRFKLDPEDINRFKAYVKRTAYLGGIPTVLDEQRLPNVFLSQTPGHWTLVPYTMLEDIQRKHDLYVRYGTVVYPIEATPEFKLAYSAIDRFIDKHVQGHALLIQAVPDSLVVMPNRESLSMQEQTINSLKLLCEEFIQKNLGKTWTDELIHAGKSILNEPDLPISKVLTFTNLVGKERAYYEDLRGSLKIQTPQDDPLEIMAQCNVTKIFRESSKDYLWRTLTKHKLKLLAARSDVDRGLIQTYFKKRLDAQKRNFKTSNPMWHNRDANTFALHDWYSRYILRPVAKKLYGAGLFIKSNLLMHGKIPADYSGTRYKRYRRSSIGFGSIQKTLAATVLESSLMIACTKHVVLTPSMRLLQQNESTIFNTFFANLDHMGLLAYVLPSKKQQQEDVRKLFKELGYTIIDLSVDSDWKHEEVKALPATPKIKKPVVEGRRSLLSYYRGSVLDKTYTEQDVKDRITQPEFYAYLLRDRNNDNTTSIDKLGSPMLSMVKSMAALGVGVETANSIPMLRNQGIPCMAEFLITNLHNHMLSSKTLKESLAYDLVDYADKKHGDKLSIYNVAVRIPELRDLLKLVDTKTDDDKLALRWWRYLKNQHQLRYHGVKSMDQQVKYLDCKEHNYLQEIEAHLAAIEFDPAVKTAYDTISSSNLIGFLDMSEIESRLLSKNPPMDPTDKKHLIEMMLTALSK